MDISQLLDQLSEIGAVVIINNLNITVNQQPQVSYSPASPWQISRPDQRHRWAGHSHPYDICECGTMTRNFHNHIVEMAEGRYDH